eukprot:scpid13446/ scgid0838/ Guanine exchange factor for Rac 30
MAAITKPSPGVDDIARSGSPSPHSQASQVGNSPGASLTPTQKARAAFKQLEKEAANDAGSPGSGSVLRPRSRIRTLSQSLTEAAKQASGPTIRKFAAVGKALNRERVRDLDNGQEKGKCSLPTSASPIADDDRYGGIYCGEDKSAGSDSDSDGVTPSKTNPGEKSPRLVVVASGKESKLPSGQQTQPAKEDRFGGIYCGESLDDDDEDDSSSDHGNGNQALETSAQDEKCGGEVMEQSASLQGKTGGLEAQTLETCNPSQGKEGQETTPLKEKNLPEKSDTRKTHTAPSTKTAGDRNASKCNGTDDSLQIRRNHNTAACFSDSDNSDSHHDDVISQLVTSSDAQHSDKTSEMGSGATDEYSASMIEEQPRKKMTPFEQEWEEFANPSTRIKHFEPIGPQLSTSFLPTHGDAASHRRSSNSSNASSTLVENCEHSRPPFFSASLSNVLSQRGSLPGTAEEPWPVPASPFSTTRSKWEIISQTISQTLEENGFRNGVFATHSDCTMEKNPDAHQSSSKASPKPQRRSVRLRKLVRDSLTKQLTKKRSEEDCAIAPPFMSKEDISSTNSKPEAKSTSLNRLTAAFSMLSPKESRRSNGDVCNLSENSASTNTKRKGLKTSQSVDFVPGGPTHRPSGQSIFSIASQLLQSNNAKNAKIRNGKLDNMDVKESSGLANAGQTNQEKLASRSNNQGRGKLGTISDRIAQHRITKQVMRSKSLERMSKSKIKEESVDELSTTLCKPIQQPSRPISPDVPAADTIADVRSVRRQHTFCETLTSDQALLDGYDTCGSSIFEEDEMPELDPGAKSGTASPLPGRGRQGSRSSKTAFLALMGENTLNNLQKRKAVRKEEIVKVSPISGLLPTVPVPENLEIGLKRFRVCQEIYSTEYSYVKNLEVLVEVYKGALKSVLSGKDLDTIFMNVESIYEFNCELLVELHDRFMKWSDDLTVGDAFTCTAARFNVYSVYCANHRDAEEAVARLKRKNDVNDTLQSAGQDARVSTGLNLQSYLLTPVQRMPRYLLLLQNLLKHTPDTHPDFEMLREAISKLDRITEHVNQQIRELQNQKALSDLRTQVVGLDAHDLPGRKLAKEGQVCLTSIRKLYQCILFNDLIVFALRGESKGKVEIALDLSTVWVHDLDQNDPQTTAQDAIEIYNPDRPYTIYVKTINEKRLWLNEIRSVILSHLKEKNDNLGPPKDLEERTGISEENVGQSAVVRASDIVHRTAKFSYASGELFDGCWLDAMRHGKGEMTWRDRTTYVGEWVENERIGEGTLTYNTADVYSGTWSNDVQCGKGELKLCSGDQYSGQWKNALPQGDGKIEYANGDIFTGAFDRATVNGDGVLKCKNGIEYDGQWLESQFDGEGKFTNRYGDRFEGELVHNCFHGSGVMNYKDGSVYDGIWEKGHRHGYGSFKEANGAEYNGNWRLDQRHGQGWQKAQDGSVYDGMWEYNARHGSGKMRFANGDEYSGLFKHNHVHGRGTMTYADGSVYIGDFKFAQRHGYGVMEYANGGHYDGSWVHDVREGEGSYTYEDEVRKCYSV